MHRIALPFLICAGSAAAQSTVSSAASFAHAANAGWIELRPSAADGVQLSETYLSGKAYAANFGWIDLGDGSPENGHAYSNTSGGDHGVNLAADGSLSGYAYAANIGWIVFEQVHGKPKLDLLTGAITGHAYAPNAGWIALDTAVSDLVTLVLLRPDSDGDGIADAWEELHFDNLTTATALSDSDGDGASDLEEYEAGSDPENAGSLFRIVSHSFGSGGSSIALTFTTFPGRLYRLEHDADLSGPWTDSPLGTFSPDTGDLTKRQFVIPGGGARFVRAIAVKPLEP